MITHFEDTRLAYDANYEDRIKGVEVFRRHSRKRILAVLSQAFSMCLMVVSWMWRPGPRTCQKCRHDVADSQTTCWTVRPWGDRGVTLALRPCRKITTPLEPTSELLSDNLASRVDREEGETDGMRNIVTRSVGEARCRPVPHTTRSDQI